MKQITNGLAVLMILGASLAFAGAEDSIEWKTIKSASGQVKSTTQRSTGGRRGSKAKYREKPTYVTFASSTTGFRVKWKTQAAGDGANLDLTLERQIDLPNGAKDWRRVEVIGRARGDDAGGGVFAQGPGHYRIEMTGQNTKYDITVEEAHRPSK